MNSLDPIYAILSMKVVAILPVSKVQAELIYMYTFQSNVLAAKLPWFDSEE